MRSYLLNSVARFEAPNEGAAEARKAAVQAARDSIAVTTAKIEDNEGDKEDKEEVKEEEKTDEQKDEDSEEKTGEKDEEKEVEAKDEDKEDDKEAKKIERLERKLVREGEKRALLAKENKALLKKLEDKGDKTLTEEDVETLAEQKAEQKQYQKQIERTAEKLADDAQKLLKLTDKQFKELVKDVVEDIGNTPTVLVELLGELDNGGAVIAHLFKNPDEAEDIYKLQNKPAKLGLELAKLSSKLSKPKAKEISKVPDPVEPLGGKSAGGDRFNILSSKKNLTNDEMAEYAALRNAQVADRRRNGRVNLR